MAAKFQSLAGQLLISHPLQQDEHFGETVVLMHVHDREGAMGVILNRPMGKCLGELKIDLISSPLASVPLYLGGPVSTDRLAFGGWRFGSRGPAALRYGISEAEALELLKDDQFKLFAFVGYAGWSPGQLENELKHQVWVTSRFERQHAQWEGRELWLRALGLQRPDLRLEMKSPEDLGLN
jgi:putative transcriptional regulator